MIVVVHNFKQVTSVVNDNFQPINVVLKNDTNIIESMLQIATQFSSELLVWCHQDLKAFLNVSELQEICHHKHILATFNTGNSYYLSDKIDYLERSICLNFDRKSTYGTYLMSGQVGVIWAETFLLFKDKLQLNRSFSYHLNGLAKQFQMEGLFCYSEPKLLRKSYTIVEELTITNSDFFLFIKEHYKWVWLWFAFLSIAVYEKRLLLFSVLKALLHKRITSHVSLSNQNLNSTKKMVSDTSIDVVIPTIGRKEYLINVLKDLAEQTILPQKVIIVEQNGNLNAVSELDYLTNKEWPFEIVHKFTHTLGVCNARNEALKSVSSQWIFFADDDIRFQPNLFESVFSTIEKFGVNALNFSCLLKDQKQTYFKEAQTFIFGSGSSFVNSNTIKDLHFDTTFEFGFGEDTDFGARIRQQGYDILYTPKIKLLHLKAPIGGFRQPIKKHWDNETIKPKPSPTMLALFIKNFTPNQLKGYKLFLFIKMYGKSNPLKLKKHLNAFRKSWAMSLFYAKQLSKNNHA